MMHLEGRGVLRQRRPDRAGIRRVRRSARPWLGLAAALALALGPLAASQAAAQDVPQWDDRYYPFAREGPYFGVTALYALENFDTEPPVDVPDAPSDISGEDGGGLGLRAGYRVHPRLAAEIQFQYYWGFEITDTAGDLPGVDDRFDGWTLTANGKLYPLLGRFQPYAVVGMGGIAFQEKQGPDAGFVARMGGGLDVYLSDQVLIDLEIAYVFPAGSISELQFVTFAGGIQYRY